MKTFTYCYSQGCLLWNRVVDLGQILIKFKLASFPYTHVMWYYLYFSESLSNDRGAPWTVQDGCSGRRLGQMGGLEHCICYSLWIYSVVSIQFCHLEDNCNYIITHREPLTLCTGQSVGWNKAADLPENSRRLVGILFFNLINLHPSYMYKVPPSRYYSSWNSCVWFRLSHTTHADRQSHTPSVTLSLTW